MKAFALFALLVVLLAVVVENGDARHHHGGKNHHRRRTTPAGGSTRPHRHSNEKDSREINVNADAADEVQVFPDLTDDANRHFGRHGRHNRSCNRSG